ncbi:hypothetical protein TNCV_1141301 [Trichonephila clavipes]|nr:hypothetical protein TNCV_1141301 [Trichonephila clavipes]
MLIKKTYKIRHFSLGRFEEWGNNEAKTNIYGLSNAFFFPAYCRLSGSCDLTPLDYFLWDYVKSLVYADKPQTLDHLEDNIHRVIADIRPQMLEKSHRKVIQIGLHPS